MRYEVLTQNITKPNCCDKWEAKLYYEVLTQIITEPNCCDKWEAKLNKDIDWRITFKKMQQI